MRPFFRMKLFYRMTLFCGKSYSDICKILHWQTASTCKYDVHKTGNTFWHTRVSIFASWRTFLISLPWSFLSQLEVLGVHLGTSIPGRHPLNICQEVSVAVRSTVRTRKSKEHPGVQLNSSWRNVCKKKIAGWMKLKTEISLSKCHNT